MPVAAIIGASVIGAGASIISGNKAASAQTHAADTATAEQQRQYDQTRADYAPYRSVGYGALGKLAGMYGVTPTNADGTPTGASGGSQFGSSAGDFQTSPGYQFRVNEATKAIERSAAARGGLRSGATMDALQRRVQGVASDEYSKYADRLASLAGIGQSATGSTAAAGQNAANNISANTIAAGNATASSYENTGNAINGGLQNIAGGYLYNNNLNRVLNGGVAGGGFGTLPQANGNMSFNTRGGAIFGG